MKDKFYNLLVVISEYSLYGLLFSLAISNAMVETFAGFMFLGFIGRKIIKPDFSFLKFWPNIFLILFLFFNALSFINSGVYFDKSLIAFIAKWMEYLGIYIIVQAVVSNQKIFRRCISVFLFGATLAILSGLSQYFFGIEFLRSRGLVKTNEGITAITSSFVQNNGFGDYLIVVSSFLLALLLRPKMLKVKFYSLLILAVLSITAIFLTFSRGSWLGLTVSFILLFIVSGKNFYRLVPILLVIITIFLAPNFQKRLFFTFGETGDSDRFRYWLVALKMIKDHPFLGLGVGTFMANYPQYLPRITVSYAHNCYLQIWAETGIFSLISFLAFISSLVYLSVKKFFVSKDLFLFGLLSGIIGYLIHSFFESNLYSLRLAVLFWAWIGLIVARLHAQRQLNEEGSYEKR